MFKYNRLAGVLLASSALISSASYAAETEANEQPTTSVGTGASDVSDEIVVTARRRQESAQKIPLAISVVGGEHIDNTGSFNVGHLQQLTPTLQFYSSNPRNSAVNIRGLVVPFGLTNDGIEQGVGIYADDVYYARVASATFDFLDVKQIEVLRGPQGTLFGKNTTAGAINITTRAPTSTFEGRTEVTIGNLGFKQAKAAVSGPLTDTVAARLALSSTNRRGTIYNRTSHNWVNEQDNLGIRGQFLWEPNDDLKVTLQGDFSTQNPKCCTQIYVGTGATQRPINRQFAALAAAQNYSVASTNPYDRVTDVDADLNASNKIGGVNFRVKWDAGPGDFTSVTAWRFWDWKPANDRDFTGLPVTVASSNPSQQNQYTQEFRYAQSNDRYDFSLGLFGFHQEIQTQGLQKQGSAASAWLLNPSSSLSRNPAVLDGLTANNNIQLKNTSAALFGQLGWKPTDALKIQPGIRINYDKKTGLFDSTVTGTASDGSKQNVLFSGPYSTDPWIKAQRGILSTQTFSPKFSDWNFSYDLTLSYQLAQKPILRQHYLARKV